MSKFILSMIAFVLFNVSQIAFAQDINFDDLQRPGPGLVQSKSVGGLASEGSTYMRQFSETDSARIEAARQARASYSSSSSSSSGSSSSNSSSSKGSGVASVRSETYDNVGRRTEGYWVECRSGSKTRVFRTAWDSNRAWYEPAFPNGRYLASSDTNINQVAQNICK